VSNNNNNKDVNNEVQTSNKPPRDLSPWLFYTFENQIVSTTIIAHWIRQRYQSMPTFKKQNTKS